MSDLHDLRRRLRQRLRGTQPGGFLPTETTAPEEPEAQRPPTHAPQPLTGEPESFLPSPSGRLPSPPPSFLAPPAAPEPAPAPPPPMLALDGLGLPGEEVAGPRGACYRLAQTALALGDGPLAERLAGCHGCPDRPALHAILSLPAERVLFLDLETCGLARVPLFLCGLAGVNDGLLGVELYLARHEGEEAAAIAAAAERLRAAEALVTFNGTTFDLPFLRARAKQHGVKLAVPTAHLDLLPLCRGRFGKTHGDCKLGTLERAVCGRRRSEEDVPGAEVPERYRTFVASGDPAHLRPVIYHNAMDLLATADLLLKLAGA